MSIRGLAKCVRTVAWTGEVRRTTTPGGRTGRGGPRVARHPSRGPWSRPSRSRAGAPCWRRCSQISEAVCYPRRRNPPGCVKRCNVRFAPFFATSVSSGGSAALCTLPTVGGAALGARGGASTAASAYGSVGVRGTNRPRGGCRRAVHRVGDRVPRAAAEGCD